MDEELLIPFGRYVRLYTLHRIEYPTLADFTVLRIRIETLRYSFVPLSGQGLDDAYAYDPREGAEMVRATVLPRLQTLLDASDPFRELGGRELWWQKYAAERGLAVEPIRAPTIHAPTPAPRLPARSKTAERLARVQQVVELARTATETAAALAAGWQNFQLGREKRRLLETQRLMLQNAIQAQLEGQGQALDHALDRRFVRGYLSEHAGDNAIDAIFDEES